MTTARRPLPTDIVALVSFDGRVHPNEAKPRDRMGVEERPHALEEALEQWLSFATGKHTWLNVKGATIRGLVTARRRVKRSAWEVEMLINAADDTSVIASLFSRMASGVMKLGAERLFLRVDAASPVVDFARAAGFFGYQKETLYCLQPVPATDAPSLPVRQRVKHDLLAIFQLYGRVAPANVRAIEGVTLREWQAAQEKWGGRPQDFLLEDDSVVNAYLRMVPGDTGRIGLLADAGRDTIDSLIRFAVARLKRSSRVLCLVPDHDIAVAEALSDQGFEVIGRYQVMAKRLTRPVGELANETTKEAITVS